MSITEQLNEAYGCMTCVNAANEESRSKLNRAGGLVRTAIDAHEVLRPLMGRSIKWT